MFMNEQMKLHMMTHGQNNVHGRSSPYFIPQINAYEQNEQFRKQGNDNNGNPIDLRQDRNNSIHYFPTNELITERGRDNASVTSDDLLLVEEHIRPLIKEELRYAIQSKRLARGLPGTVEIEYKAPQNDDVSPQTVIKRERRRERNKVAAAKCRFKKKIVSEKLQEESENLENTNLKLKREIQRLQEERQKLVYILNVHKPTCIARSLSDDKELIAAPTNSLNKFTKIESIEPSNGSDFNFESWQANVTQNVNMFVDSILSSSMSESSTSQRTLTQSC